MANPVKRYQQEMHNKVGFFATWLPGNIIQPGDFGVLKDGTFKRLGSITDLGGTQPPVREGSPQDMSYYASASRNAGIVASAGAVVPATSAETSISFSSAGGFIFEAIGIRSLEIENRLQLAQRVLNAFEQKGWTKDWLLIDSIYKADSATIIVSVDSSSSIKLTASTGIPVASLPLADPRLGLTASSQSGRIVQVVAKAGLTPLYSCMQLRTGWRTEPDVVPVRGIDSEAAAEAFTRPSIDDLLNS